MSDIGIILGLVLGFLGLVAAVYFGVRGIYLGNKELREQKEIGVGIERLAKGTLKAIEKDGAETRRAILGVHKSIKEELNK